VSERGGSRILQLYGGSLIKGSITQATRLTILALSAVYPNYPWKQYDYRTPHQSSSRAVTSKSQITLLRVVESLFASHELQVNFRHPDMLYPNANRSIEFDVSQVED
jgi:hypothetical protein